MPRYEKPASEYIKKLVYLNRVSKTVKGSSVMKFSVLMVVGDGKGKVGFGLGKASRSPGSHPQGHRRCQEEYDYRGNVRDHHPPTKSSVSSPPVRVLMKPAPDGTGVIAGGPVRAVMEAAGIKDIRTKCLRSHNPQNVVHATFEGLMSLRTPNRWPRPAARPWKICREVGRRKWQI